MTTKDNPTTTGSSLADLQLITPTELGQLLGRSASAIRFDASQRPNSLPPRFRPPGVTGRTALRWRVRDVREWMERAAAVVKEQKEEVRRTAAKAGLDPAETGAVTFHLGHKALGTAANKR